MSGEAQEYLSLCNADGLYSCAGLVPLSPFFGMVLRSYLFVPPSASWVSGLHGPMAASEPSQGETVC